MVGDPAVDTQIRGMNTSARIAFAVIGPVW
jgi:hypothetical protein